MEASSGLLNELVVDGPVREEKEDDIPCIQGESEQRPAATLGSLLWQEVGAQGSLGAPSESGKIHTVEDHAQAEDPKRGRTADTTM